MRNEFSDIFPSRSLSYLKIVKGESFFQRKQCIWLLPTLIRLQSFPDDSIPIIYYMSAKHTPPAFIIENADTLTRKHRFSVQKFTRRLEISAVLVEISASTAEK